MPVSPDSERAATGVEPRWSVSNMVASDQISSTHTVSPPFRGRRRVGRVPKVL